MTHAPARKTHNYLAQSISQAGELQLPQTCFIILFTVINNVHVATFIAQGCVCLCEREKIAKKASEYK